MTPVCDAPRVAAWVSARIGHIIMPPFMALGWERDGELCAGAVFNDYVPGGNIELTLATAVPATRPMIRAIAHYVFVQLGCARLSITTRADNANVIGLAKRLGFRAEGVRADYYSEGAHAALFRMKRRECKWLRVDP